MAATALKDKFRSSGNVIGFALAALLAAALLVSGAVFSEYPWAPPAMVGGVLGLLIVALCIWRSTAVFAIHGVVLVMSAAAIIGGARYGGGPWVIALITLGVAGLMFASISLAIALQLASRNSQGPGVPGAAAGMASDARVVKLLEQLVEQAMLTDNTRSVLFRTRELELLRATIEEDIAHGDYDAAVVLCDDMAQRFGAREEAEQYRTRIQRSRREHYEANVHAALGRLDELLSKRDWAHAHEEAARIRRLYPDSAAVLELDARINAARQEHKHDLEMQFVDAANREDVESAMPLLRELDRYLTPEDAVRLREIAQGVIARHRENLGVQFKLAVNDRRWAEAARIGQAIIEEFPNSKMAGEVRPMLDVLRTRASQAAVASSE
jgi:tetratricopeptide (TPR) repeat protein